MKKSIWLLMCLFVFVVLSACNEKKVEEMEMPEILEVKLEVMESADVDEQVTMKAIVTQGEDKVSDAKEVEFEVWQGDKKSESKSIAAKNNQDGTYEAETAFEQDGVYSVQVHVTARGLHAMPKKEVTVGTGEAAESDHEDGAQEHGDQGHADGFSMHFMKPESVQIEQEVDLTVHLQNEGASLEKARVRYEVWNDEISEKHDWLDTKEVNPGEYTVKHTFAESGTYKIQVHVTNDDGLHEHEEHEIEVKN